MPLNVLIVEDEIFVALDIETTAEDAGYTVVGIAPDSRAAFDLAPRAELAFVDLNLRDGLTGIGIGHKLAAEFGITVVYMTANPSLLGEGVSGTIGVLTKPCSPVVMRAALEFAAARRASSAACAEPPVDLRIFA
jgi:two-component system, response regulator PdtaR